jgi:hypothetical protein
MRGIVKGFIWVVVGVVMLVGVVGCKKDPYELATRMAISKGQFLVRTDLPRRGSSWRVVSLMSVNDGKDYVGRNKIPRTCRSSSVETGSKWQRCSIGC